VGRPNDSVHLSGWRGHPMGIDALCVGRSGVFAYCPVCATRLTVDQKEVTCPQCGSVVRIEVRCRETTEGQGWTR